MSRPAGPQVPLSSEAAERVARLYDLHRNRVLAVARRFTLSPDVAQDVAGETWLRVTRSIASLQGAEENAGAWLATICRRAAADFYRPRRSWELPTDWSDPAWAVRLPAVSSVEQLLGV
ncbi:sigma factor [Nonomuraea sp. NPDC049158]|uniref:RNA polymerase sigma factor n=1 Tax=Nonomuraea sp. NPDC049158 TaxID=3155649 RepID=UPI0033C6359E